MRKLSMIAVMAVLAGPVAANEQVMAEAAEALRSLTEASQSSTGERSIVGLLAAVQGLSQSLYIAQIEADNHELRMLAAGGQASYRATRDVLPRIADVKIAGRADRHAYLATGRMPHLEALERELLNTHTEAEKARLKDLLSVEMPDRFRNRAPY
jgi:hypothetical protein